MPRSLRVNYQAEQLRATAQEKNHEQNRNWNIKQPEKNVSRSGQHLNFEIQATTPSNS